MTRATDKMVVGITGDMLSGKTTATDYIAEKFGAKKLKFSAILNRILEVLDIPSSRENQQKLVAALRENYGEGVLTPPIIDSIEKSEHSLFLVDGFRKLSELEELRKLSNFKLLFIKSPIEIRYKRQKTRHEKIGESEQSYEEFLKRQHDEADKDVVKLEQYADCVIENSSTMEDLKQKVLTFFNSHIC